MRKATRGCTPWSSGCHHLMEGVPHFFSLLSSSRLQGVVAVVLFLQDLEHWMELFLTAPVAPLISLSFFRTCILTCAVHEHQNGDNFFCGKTNSSRLSWPCARLSGRPDSLSVPSSTKNAMSALRASDFYPTGPHGAEECRDFDGHSLTGIYELRLIKVCDEVSMRSCFWLIAAIAIRQERLLSLLVDPACMLKLAWCKYMQG